MMKKKPIEYVKLVVVIVCLIAIVSSLTVLFYHFISVKKIIEYDAFLNVSNKIGFDVSPDYIHFGTVMPGGSSVKSMTLMNKYGSSLKIQAKVTGDLRGLINFDLGNSSTIYPGINKTIYMTVLVPEGMPYGDYAGKVQIIFRRF
jgi:hypothetical protein